MTTGTWLPMRYRDFYDVPRLVAVEYHGRVYLFDSPFDDRLDDYADEYAVYRLPKAEVASLDNPSWEGLVAASEQIGTVKVSDVTFDETGRACLNDSVFTRLSGRY